MWRCAYKSVQRNYRNALKENKKGISEEIIVPAAALDDSKD